MTVISGWSVSESAPNKLTDVNLRSWRDIKIQELDNYSMRTAYHR